MKEYLVAAGLNSVDSDEKAPASFVAPIEYAVVEHVSAPR